MPVINAMLTDFRKLAVRAMLVDRNLRLEEEGIDVAVRIGALADSSLISTRIGSVQHCIVASPDYLDRFGIPKAPSDLADHEIVLGDTLPASDTWWFGAARRAKISVQSRLRVNSLDSVLEAVRNGAGIARLFSYQVANDVSSGTLRTVLNEYVPPALPVSIVYPPNRSALPSVQAFVARMKLRSQTARWMLP